MPVFPKIKVSTPQYCNLRQALQWLQDDLQPVDPQFEPALGYPRFDSTRDYSRAKSAIYAALLAGQIKLLGRFGQGGINPIVQYDSTADWHYGDREEVSVARIIEAGFYDLDFESGTLSTVTEWEDEGGPPLAGWQYVGLMIPTADLMRVFPPSHSSEIPIVIELKRSDTSQSLTLAALPPQSLLFLREAVERIADHTGAAWSKAAMALHDALCSGQVTADADGNEVPCNTWCTYCPNDFVDRIECGNDRCWEADGLRYSDPTLTVKSIDSWLLQSVAAVSTPSIELGFIQADDYVSVAQSKAQTDALPIYLQFLNDIVSQLGGSDRIAERKKADLKAEIAARWRPELGQWSDNLIGMMATILRPPEAQRGGAKPMRALENGAPHEGSNDSIHADKLQLK